MIEKDVLELLVSEYEEIVDEPWKIKNDNDAEYLIDAVNEDLVEINRYEMALVNKIDALKEKLDKVRNEKQFKIEKRNGYLLQYFETIPEELKKKTKTMEKYRLPSGEIVKKYQNPDYKRDETKLVNWIKSNKLNDYVETVEKPKWGELKKLTITKGSQVILQDTGEIIEGVEAIEKPPVIEFKEV